MAESILERIAVWHAAAVADVTLVNGYQQTLSVTRPQDLVISGRPVTDLTTICCLGECIEDQQRSSGMYFWRQTFETLVHMLGGLPLTAAVDTRITRIVADLHKRFGIELAAARVNGGRYCGGLAYQLELLPWEISVLGNREATLISVPVAIAFEVDADDPYSQTL